MSTSWRCGLSRATPWWGASYARRHRTRKCWSLRFSAVEPRWRAASLARVLYLAAFRTARELGCPLVTLGNDPNLYGHVAKPGLMLFKARLGFRPVPAGTVVPTMAGDVADRIVLLKERAPRASGGLP